MGMAFVRFGRNTKVSAPEPYMNVEVKINMGRKMQSYMFKIQLNNDYGVVITSKGLKKRNSVWIPRFLHYNVIQWNMKCKTTPDMSLTWLRVNPNNS